MPARSLPQLIRQRNDRRGSLTRSLTQLELLVQENGMPELIQERPEDVECLYKETQEAQKQLQAGMDSEDDLEQELDMWDELKSRKYPQSAWLRDFTPADQRLSILRIQTRLIRTE